MWRMARSTTFSKLYDSSLASTPRLNHLQCNNQRLWEGFDVAAEFLVAFRRPAGKRYCYVQLCSNKLRERFLLAKCHCNFPTLSFRSFALWLQATRATSATRERCHLLCSWHWCLWKSCSLAKWLLLHGAAPSIRREIGPCSLQPGPQCFRRWNLLAKIMRLFGGPPFADEY